MAEANMPFRGHASQHVAAGYGRAQYGYTQGYQAHPHPDPALAPAGVEAPAAGGTLATLGQVTGALVSIALVVGVSVWGYQLIMRDVSGVPVVRASEGPMRIAPERPGGAQAAHQGLSVNEVPGRGSAGGPVNEVLLAPPPLELSNDDQPAGTPGWAGQEAVMPVPDAPAPAAPTAPQTADLQAATIEALANRIAGNVAPLSDLQPVEAETPPEFVTPVAAAASPAPVALVSGTGAMRPQARPATLVTAALSVPAAESLGSGALSVVDLDPADLQAGTRLVQLGAYDSVDTAQREWIRIAGQFDSFFTDKRRVIERAQSGGRTFFRLRAEGFDDLGDARRFCAALVAERTDCIPVETR